MKMGGLVGKSIHIQLENLSQKEAELDLMGKEFCWSHLLS